MADPDHSFTAEPSSPLRPGCELCGDQPESLELRARCHLTAPLRATLRDGILEIRCYVPECNRLVATFNVRSAAGI